MPYSFFVLPVFAHALKTSCGDGCVFKVEPWCTNSLRIRISLGEPLDNLPGALSANPFCGTPDGANRHKKNNSQSFPGNSVTNGALTAEWDTVTGLRFVRDDGKLLLSTLGPLSEAISIKPATPPPPRPAPFACQDSCTLGATGILEHTDALDCNSSGVSYPKLVNITRGACCNACVNQSSCQAWAWGRDSADAGHRHNCYLCSSLKGTKPRSDRDFGCVERSIGTATKTEQTDSTAYYSTSAAFFSPKDEYLTGLGEWR
jgi:hypothetical protein